MFGDITVSIPPEDYNEKAKKFENIAASSHATEYVAEEIAVSGVLDKSEDIFGETKHG